MGGRECLYEDVSPSPLCIGNEGSKKMKTFSILNVKGGVAKTTSSLAIAEVLSEDYGYKVLLVDADQQGNATHTLLPDVDNHDGTAELLLAKDLIPASEVIQPTEYGIDVIGGTFRLMEADKLVMLDTTRPQQFRLRRQLRQSDISEKYDFCIIDCPPNLNVAAVNALAASDEVLVPIRADRYGFDGMEYVVSAINEMCEYNSSLHLAGCFLTVTDPRTNVTQYSAELLKKTGIPALRTAIRSCTKVGESTFVGKPLLRYAPNCTAAQDYRALVKELLRG